MVITHVLLGLLATLPLTLLGAWAVGPVLTGALVGGALPDLDLLVGTHRRTLHFPVLGLPVAALAVALALAVPGPASVAIAAALGAAALHATSDILGAGEELRPWERTNTDAVYCHLLGRWLTARYVVRYDGSPEDLGLSLVAAAPVALSYTGPVRWVLGGLIVVAVVYALLRKRLVPYFEPIV